MSATKVSKKEVKRRTHFAIAFALYSAYLDGVGDSDEEIWIGEMDRHLVKAGKTIHDFKPDTREEGR